jgi:hypothetical protein
MSAFFERHARTIILVIMLGCVIAYMIMTRVQDSGNTPGQSNTRSDVLRAPVEMRHAVIANPEAVAQWCEAGDSSFRFLRESGITCVVLTTAAWHPDPESPQLEYSSSSIRMLSRIVHSPAAAGFTFGVMPVLVDIEGCPTMPKLRDESDIQRFYGFYDMWLDDAIRACSGTEGCFVVDNELGFPQRSASSILSSLEKLKQSHRASVIRNTGSGDVYLFWQVIDGAAVNWFEMTAGSGADDAMPDSLTAYALLPYWSDLPVALWGFDGGIALDAPFRPRVITGGNMKPPLPVRQISDSVLLRCSRVPQVRAFWFSLSSVSGPDGRVSNDRCMHAARIIHEFNSRRSAGPNASGIPELKAVR